MGTASTPATPSPSPIIGTSFLLHVRLISSGGTRRSCLRDRDRNCCLRGAVPCADRLLRNYRPKVSIPERLQYVVDEAPPLELAVRNEADRFSLAILAIDHLKDVLGNKGAGPRERLLEQRLRATTQAYETGMDPEELTNWSWPY